MSNSLINLVPDPLYSDLQYERFHHLDIPCLEDAELIDELHALAPLLWWRLPHGRWLRERVGELQKELSKRQFDMRYKFSKPKPVLSHGVKL